MTLSAARRSLTVVVGLFCVFLLVDLLRPPERQLSAVLLLFAIDRYQATVSPRMESAGVRCRFEPTCSQYAETVIRRDGAAVGVWKATWRVLRCGPWTPLGTADPP